MGKQRGHRSLQFSGYRRQKEQHEFSLGRRFVIPDLVMRRFEKQTYPCVDGFVSRGIEKALDDGFHEGTLVVGDIEDVCKVPFGLGGSCVSNLGEPGD